jgi:hypothetical protein
LDNVSSCPCKRVAFFIKRKTSSFFHLFFLNTSIFKIVIFTYNISAPREKTYGNKMKEGDSTGEVQGVNETPQTSLAAAILKGMDVLQGAFIARNKH